MMKVKTNRINKTLKETLTTSPEMIVDERVTMREAVNDPHKRVSNRIQKQSGRRNKENMGKIPLMYEENKKRWLMMRMHHAVSWWSYPLENGMIYHLLESCLDRPHNKKSFRWNPSQIKFNNVSCTTKKCQYNACDRYHNGCCSISRYWWKLVTYWQSVDVQCLSQQQISVKHKRCSWWTIYTCKL